ncbi:hypothetical protein AWB79_02804 [Caballeronia hypogeia]|uniref:Lipoprotein n=1 Tax=Caballeronia hypogeia TaxID=1777140 RepID=A0A158AUF6_9BURK|nr:hypothetical protein [Caballeronia hypogeia]SAK61452.1 hypothetical protein AWB79_02804 [Caballeronia hypogeia]
MLRNSRCVAVITTFILVCGLTVGQATPLDSQAENDKEICNNVNLKAIARNYLDAPENATSVYLLANPGFDDKIVRRETLAGFTYFVAPLETIPLCANATNLAKSSVEDNLFTERDIRFTAAKVFSKRLLAQSNQGDPQPTIVRIELDNKERALEEIDELRSRADLVQLGIESSVRYRYLENHLLRFTAENLIQAAAIPTRYFKLKLIYAGVLSPDVGKDIILEIALVSGVPATEISLIGDPNGCGFEQPMVMYFEESKYGPKNYIFIASPGLYRICSFAGLSTALSASSLSSVKNFDSTTNSDTFFVIDLLRNSLLRMGISGISVEPAGPIESKEAYVTIKGLRDRINMPGVFTGKRNERVFLKIKLKENILSIDQRYEYSDFSGTLRWRDPEDPQYASTDFAKGASLFLGRLISEIKYVLTASK